MSPETSSAGRLTAWVWLIAFAQLVLHLATNTRYGYFGDELYYLACADHLAWGYVDQPPFSIALLAAWKGLFGDSLAALRVPPALATAAIVVLTGLIAREFGGGRFAQSLAALATAIAGVNLVIGGYYSMNPLDALVWVVAFYSLARLLEQPSPARWLALGALLGVGLLNKISVLWLGLGLFAGLAVTPYRSQLRTPWPWLAGGLAALLFAPHLIWQVQNGWPTAEFVRVATSGKMIPVGPLDLLAQQVLAMHPLTAPLWAAGLAWLLLARGGARSRVFGVVFLVVAAILIANGTSRPNYLALAQPPLLAAGGVWFESLTKRRRAWLRPAAAALLVGTGLAGAPLVVPLLEPEDVIAYGAALGIEAPRMEHGHTAALAQHFADMHGWPEIVAAVAEVHRALDPEDRARVGVFAGNYAEAGAVDLLGRPLGLPAAISNHNNYWLWGPGDVSGELMIILGGDEARLRELYADLRQVGTLRCEWCMPSRNGKPIYLARGPRRPLAELWPELRHYD